MLIPNLSSLSLDSIGSAAVIVVLSSICCWYFFYCEKGTSNAEKLDCAGLNYAINLTKSINVEEVDQGHMWQIKPRTTIFVFTIKSNTAQREWIIFKQFSDLWGFYEKLQSVMAEPPPFPGSCMRSFNVVKQENQLKDWLQNVVDLAKLLETVRISLEKEFDIDDLSRHVRNADSVMVEYLLKQKLSLSTWLEHQGETPDSQVEGEKKETTALHMAAAWGDEKCVKLLLDNGYRADTVDN